MTNWNAFLMMHHPANTVRNFASAVDPYIKDRGKAVRTGRELLANPNLPELLGAMKPRVSTIHAKHSRDPQRPSHHPQLPGNERLPGRWEKRPRRG